MLAPASGGGLAMKYALFISTRYYPNGGMDDYMGGFDDLATAQAVVRELVRVERVDLDELSAQIAICADSELTLVCRFVRGEWVDDNKTPTLETQYLSYALGDYLHPERIAEREADRLRWQQAQAKKAAIDKAFHALGKAIYEDDHAAVALLSEQLREMGALL
jgi:hypothetical protein